MKRQKATRGNWSVSLQDVRIYFNQKGMPIIEAETFYQFYEKKRWTSKNGIPLTKWKNFAYRWIAAVVLDQPLLFDRKIH